MLSICYCAFRCVAMESGVLLVMLLTLKTLLVHEGAITSYFLIVVVLVYIFLVAYLVAFLPLS